MNAPLPVPMQVNIPSLNMNEGELIKVLESSIYPGAEVGSIKLVIGVCRAAQLDPLQKPYHIVPMDVKVKLKEKKDGKYYEYVKRDVVMPGIGLYRIQAERSGEYAGKSEPVFGPMVKMTWKEKYREDENSPELTRDAEFEYPEWCRMTVRRLVAGQIVEFAHTEFWIENYATKGRNSKQPNAMWAKRPRGQIAKCTEAQCLRIAFPSIGAQPTAEEMEGKTLDTDVDGNVIDGKTGQIIPPLMAGGQPQQEKLITGTDGAADPAAATTTNGGDDKLLTDGERAHVKAKLEAAALTEIDLKNKFGVDLAGLKGSQFKPAKDWIAANKK